MAIHFAQQGENDVQGTTVALNMLNYIAIAITITIAIATTIIHQIPTVSH